MRISKRRYVNLLLVALLGLGIWHIFSTVSSSNVQATAHPRSAPITPIQHTVFIMQENHTFDNLFGRFPGANGMIEPAASNPLANDIGHGGALEAAAVDNGKMDEFPQRGHVQYTQQDIPNYWKYAQQFGLGDNFFTSIATDSTPNHIAMIAAQSGGAFDQGKEGCRSVANDIITSKDETSGYEYRAFPCYNIPSLPKMLDQNGISWRYYGMAGLWDAPLFIQAIDNSKNNGFSANQFVTDVNAGRMADVSWVTPDRAGISDHPPNALQGGQNFITNIVNTVMNSPYWSSTAIFVTWDDWGGFYDHVVPPQIDGVGLGARAPLLVISPYAKQGYISHQLGEFSSFVKFVEDNYVLPNLGQRDARSDISDLMDFFDFNQTPQPPMILNLLNYSKALTVTNVGKKAIPSAIQPYIGGTSTDFTYEVIYTLNQTPAIHNVTIDGVDYPMKSAGPIIGGTLYKYVTRLPVGKHSFSFTFSDINGTMTLPYNGVPMDGPQVYQFSLKRAVNPATAKPGQPVTFSAIYQSSTNTPPTLSVVDIDDVTYQLQSTGKNYQKGVTYKVTLNNLSIGAHYNRFRFDDGSGNGVAIYEGSELPFITPLLLSNSSVMPTSGTISTPFTFQTTYTNSSNAPPTSAELYVDNTAYPMTYVSGAYNTGAVYQVTTTLASGNHTFFFVFDDTQVTKTSWADPFDPNVYQGPNVGPHAQPVAPGTIIGPSHEDDPDQPMDPDS